MRSIILTRQKEILISELFDALQRLASENTRIVKAPYTICQSTVCKEAGRHRSSIKNTPVFRDIRAAIACYVALIAENHQKPKADSDQVAQLRKKNERLKTELSSSEETLDAAVQMIFDLNRALIRVEDDYRSMITHMAAVRATNDLVDRALRMSGFDRLFDVETSAME